MDQQEIPDTSRWKDNLAEGKRVLALDGHVIGFMKKLFTYDLKDPDEQIRKLMRQCVVFYAFGVECAAKSWTVYVKDGPGSVRSIVYSAILIDGPRDKWIIGLPDEIWDLKTDMQDGKLIGITVFLKTGSGIRINRIANPDCKK